MDKIPIIHVYGHLGYLEWQNITDFRKYTPIDDVQNIITGMSQLSVIHEQGGKVQKNFIDAQGLIQECEKIRFLGYGFHSTNTERLNVVGNAKGKDVRATAYRISNLERLIIQKQYEFVIELDNDNTKDIIHFFRESISLED
jgi:hypothetical protein